MACAALALVAAGCASIARAPAGPLKVGATKVALTRDWNDVTPLLPGQVKKVRVLSIDGPLLNRLYITDGLGPGDRLIKGVAKEKPTPTLRVGMTSAERMEFVADSVAAIGYQRVETVKPRPVRFDGQPGIRFDLTARTPEGLNVAGTAQAAEVAGKTYVVLYLAPAEHYYAATLADVEQVMTSASAAR